MGKTTESDNRADSFDLDRFRRLLQLMEKYGVTEVSLQNDAESWKVRRGPRTVAYENPGRHYAPFPVSAPASSAPASSAPASSAQTLQPAAVEPQPGTTINAPTVGTFYTAATPEDEPFVTVGSTVKPDTVVCIIEAMKVFNQINAEKTGRITEILVENGAAVEFGQPLYRLESV